MLVVCNGCTDDSEAIAACLSEQDERVRVLVSAPEQGKAGALNLGVAHARGEFVVFADARQSFAPLDVDQASRFHLMNDHQSSRWGRTSR